MFPIKTISVAMCTHNGEAFIREQLDSICSQTFPPSELIICDDCSKDATLKIIYDFKENCNFPIIIIANKKNIGVNRNFENAIVHCSGEFIALADQDDIWHPTKIEEIISAFQDNPDCGYVFSNAELVSENGNSLNMDLWQSIKFNKIRIEKYGSSDQLAVILRGGNFIYGMTMAFRSVYKPTLLPIKSESYMCTHDTWISMILSGIGAYGVAISKCLVKYRQHKGQLSGGGRKLTFVEFVKHSLNKKAEIDMVFVEALMNIIDRLCHEDLVNENASSSINQLTEKANHLRSRYMAGSSKGILKLKIVFLESITGRYGRYSGSIKSILQDLLLSSKFHAFSYMNDLYDVENNDVLGNMVKEPDKVGKE